MKLIDKEHCTQHLKPWKFLDMQIKIIIKQVKDLKLNLDVSHWVVVHERLFEDQYDIDWPEIL